MKIIIQISPINLTRKKNNKIKKYFKKYAIFKINHLNLKSTYNY